MPDPLVSVVIPVYNGERYLAQALESVFVQAYRPIEVLVVDDGSTDASGAIAQQFPVRYLRQAHGGPGAARNMGIAQSEGALFAGLDADDLWTPDKLISQTALLAERPDVEAVLGQVEQFLDPDIVGAAPPPQFTSLMPIGLHPGTMLIRREAFHRIGLYSANWQVGDVVDWFVRAEEAHLHMVILPQVVMRRRIHTDNLTIRSRAQANLEYARIIKAKLERQRGRGAS